MQTFEFKNKQALPWDLKPVSTLSNMDSTVLEITQLGAVVGSSGDSGGWLLMSLAW